MRNSPRRETAGGFCSAVVVMFMVQWQSRDQRVLLRYYICEDDRLRWRIPGGLHRKILSGEVPIPAFAGTRQRVLEVFISPIDRQKILDVRGSIYSFQEDGSFDESAAVELMPSVWQQEIKKTPSGAIDATGKFQHRRWLSKNTWTPNQALRRSVSQELKSRASVPSLAKLVATSKI